MPKYGKRPTVKKFRWQPTTRGRQIRKATLERKNVRQRRGRQEKTMRPKKSLRPTR